MLGVLEDEPDAARQRAQVGACDIDAVDRDLAADGRSGALRERGRGGNDTIYVMTDGVRLGRVAGVELVLDRSWFVIAALTVVMYGPVLWRLYPGLGWLNLVLALGFAVGLALTVFAGPIVAITERAAADLDDRTVYIEAVLGL